MNIKDFIRWVFRKKKYKKIVIVNSMNAETLNDTITIVKKNNSYSWVKFKCPCGCNRDVILSLNQNIKPYWNIKLMGTNNSIKVTLEPSINLTGYSCKSHFFINNNKIDWV